MAEQRKLIKLGNSSFAIALPKDWIERSGLKKGDDIFVIPSSNGELIISSTFKKSNGDKERTINVDDKDIEKINREFISAYVNGSSVFNFKGKFDSYKSKEIKKIIKSFIGVELTEEKEDSLMARDFFNFEEAKLEHFTKRADNNVKEMFSVVIEGFKKGKISKEEIENIKEADRDTNKIYFLNSRVLNMGLENPTLITSLKVESSDLFNNWWLTFNLEHIGDEIKYIATMINNNKNKVNSEKVSQMLNEIKGFYEQAIGAFYSKDKEKVHNMMGSGKLLWEKYDKISKSDEPFFSLMGEKMKNIENGSYQIIKTILNLEK